MYKHFFKLRQDPFGIVPDPQFFYPTEWHNEAAAGFDPEGCKNPEGEWRLGERSSNES